MADAAFAGRVLAWFDTHGRKHLPWQQDKTRYRVWVSEIMLQQTQVATVIGYFDRFIARFPDVASLADADVDDVLALWSGLGYYARGRNLHKAAQQVRDEHAGEFPGDIDALIALPGIGRSTAAAILALTDNQRHAILDGNVKRVLARHDAVAGWPGKTDVHKALWAIAERYTPDERVADYTQAMMDLGATLCTRTKPACDACPVSGSCVALRAGNILDYPGKKPRKAKPKRAAALLVLITQRGHMMLQRRPAEGIWGGLWSFPEADADIDQQGLQSAAGQLLPPRANLVGVSRLPAFVHKFTHFDFEIIPYRIDVEMPLSVADSAKEPGVAWFDPTAIETVGVPRPVSRIVESLHSTQDLLEHTS